MPGDVEEFEVVEKPVAKPTQAALAIASAREKLAGFLPRAVEIMTELAETSENDRVRLAAAESIADRAGLGRSQTHVVEAPQAEHDLAAQEAAALLEGIRKNQELQAGPDVSLEALIVHEGEEVQTVAST